MREMVAEEQRLITVGRLEDAVAAITRRQQATALLPLTRIAEGPNREILAELLAEGDKTLTLLCALRDELRGRMSQDKQLRHAVGRYAGSQSL